MHALGAFQPYFCPLVSTAFADHFQNLNACTVQDGRACNIQLKHDRLAYVKVKGQQPLQYPINDFYRRVTRVFAASGQR